MKVPKCNANHNVFKYVNRYCTVCGQYKPFINGMISTQVEDCKVKLLTRLTLDKPSHKYKCQGQGSLSCSKPGSTRVVSGNLSLYLGSWLLWCSFSLPNISNLKTKMGNYQTITTQMDYNYICCI